MSGVSLREFEILEPKRLLPQAELNAWMIEALCRSRGEAVRSQAAAAISRFSCSPGKLGSRGVELDDFAHLDWERMRLFGASDGVALEERMKVFEERAAEAFRRFYPESGARSAPEQLLHVTCTGYAAPNPAQRLVASRGWGASTRVANVYHMGCYASLPAVRTAAAFAAGAGKERVDVVHTELCSLHFDPRGWNPEEIVVQSLFADGCAKYSAVPADASGAPGLRVLALEERLLPETSDDMTWRCGADGFRMSLARRVPKAVAENLPSFVEALFLRAGFSAARDAGEAVFAIHPGGPRVLDEVAERLGIEERRMESSRRVFFERGNMSSATLPFIWKDVLDDARVPPGSLVVSLAFGPGLTVAGGLFRKEGA